MNSGSVPVGRVEIEPMTLDELRTQIKRVIVSELDLRSRTPESIRDDEPLFGPGLGLDSLDALQLAMAIEEQFGVPIPEGEEAQAIFTSVTTLARHITAASADRR